MVKVLRRIHMYVALALGPWMLMYALSGIVMNHRPFFNGLYGGQMHKWEVERELTYPGQFSADATADEIARAILTELDLDGPHWLQNQSRDGRIVRMTIWRQNPVHPRQITYGPDDGKVVIHKQVFRTPTFLMGIHHRRGMHHEYVAANVWGGVVDLLIVAMLVWCVSGVWILAKIPEARRWGAIGLIVGVGVFAFFLCMI